ncbi:MAG: hypothetical protein U1F61_13435 [Opitutaceae bacterium]
MQQLCIFFWLFAAIVVLATLAVSAKRALTCLLVCVLICPVLPLGALTLRLELVMVPLLFGLLVASNPAKLFAVLRGPCSVSLLVWLAWVVAASLLCGGWHLLANFAWWLELYGLVRLALVFWLFAMFAWSRAEVIALIRFFALTAVPVCVLSIGQVLQWGWARSLSLTGFVPATSPVFQQQLEKEETGYVFRALGVFGNVSPCAYYFAIVAGCCMIALLDQKVRGLSRSRLYWLGCGCFGLLGGISTMSGTFVAGLPIVMLLCFWLSRRNLSYRRLYLLLGIFLAAFIITVVVVYSSPRLKAQYDYQVEGLLSGERFKSRYDDEIGITRQAKNVIEGNPLLGGFGREEEIFIGDSILTLLGFYGGYVGATLFTVFLVLLYYRTNRPDQTGYGILWLIGALLFGASTTSFFTLRMADWWWALMGIFTTCSLTGTGSPTKGRAASVSLDEVPAEFGGIGTPGTPKLDGSVSL